MEFIYIGDIVNTHGIKGEVKILSDIKYKDLIFSKNNNLYVGKNKEKLIINSYRKHKNFDMVTFDGITNINDVLIYKSEKVYINRNEINIDGYFKEDLIGLNVYSSNKYVGEVVDIVSNGIYDIFVIYNNSVKNLVPNIDEFVSNIDIENKIIYINSIEGLLNED